MENKLIKAVHTPRYSVELFLTPSDFYVINKSTSTTEPKVSEVLKDYNIASYLFDLAAEEFEGN